GSFGRELARELLLHDCEVFAVVRGESAVGARERLRTIVGASPKLHAVHGDIALGIPRIPDVDAVLHGAASTAFGLPLAEARRTNVEATRNVLELASAVPGLTKLGYISTAFVAGRRTGRILESELQHDAGFVNSYEQSKYEAELLVRASDLPVP